MRQLALLASAIVLIGTTENGPSEPQSSNGDNEGGRYRLIAINETAGYSTPFVIDTQTGRVWREAIDDQHKIFIFVSLDYRNIKGELSKVPNETATNVALMNQTTSTNLSSSTDSTSGEQSNFSKLLQLKQDFYFASKEADYWQEQLANIKAGKQWIPITGWDKDGKPIVGQPEQPNDAAKKQVQQILNYCLKVKGQKQEQIQQLPK